MKIKESHKFSAEVKEQLKWTKKGLRPKSEMYVGLCEFTKLIEIFFKYMEYHMDKQINKVKKDVQKNDKKKAQKDIKKLLKMDKKFDREIDECKDMKKKKKK